MGVFFFSPSSKIHLVFIDFTTLSISLLKELFSPFAEISEIVPSSSTINVKTDDIVV